MFLESNIRATEKELKNIGISISDIQEDLSLPNPEYQKIVRFGKGRFYKKVDKNICYLKKIKDEYVIPRYYFSTSSSILKDFTVTGKHMESTNSISLRGYQLEFVDKYISDIESSTGILLEAACGSGKTILGIWISYLRGVKTMVLVPTYYLAKQWRNRIKDCTTASVTILQASDTEITTDSDFTIVVMDLFTCRTLPEELINNIGHVILDEAHRVGADTYLPILDSIPAKYRTALTATFRRQDGVHRILQYHFGKHLKMQSRFPRPLVYGVKTNVGIKAVVSKNKAFSNFLLFLNRHKIKYHETKGVIAYTPEDSHRELLENDYKLSLVNKTAYHEVSACLKRGSEMSYSVVDSYLNEHSGRRKTAISVVQKCLDSGRTVLFLSKRKDTLKALYKYFSGYRPMLIISETNERSEEDEKYLQNSCPLILGVVQLAKEGLDIDRLDTLVIHMPMVDTEQATGRISRLYPGKRTPIVLYLVDNCGMTYAVYSKAKRYFAINAEYKRDCSLNELDLILK